MSSATQPSTTYPIVWTIAGSDPCGGAGIQADLKTFVMLDVHGCSVIAAMTAQNSFAVRSIESVSAPLLTAQIEALAEDMQPRALKIGMLGDGESVKALAACLETLKTYVVCDPVMIASAGTPLISSDVISLMKRLLFSHIDLLTPNIAEAEILVGYKILNAAAVEQAARDILAMGVKSVVLKGWLGNKGYAQDCYNDGTDVFWLTSPLRESASARGTGCTFSAVHAAAHARGFSLADSAVMAKAYVNQALRLSQAIGRGAPLLGHHALPCAPEDFPWLTSTASAGCERPHFPDCGNEALGFYPIVDSFDWLQRLLPLGVTTAQLRIKDKTGEALEDEIGQSIKLARHYGCRLFINDYWQSAIRQGAYGVHLGQEDLLTADMNAIQKSGVRLGISTHCYAEVARACGFRPSYIAVGPIFETTLKKMAFAPQGPHAVSMWRHMLKAELVAIGGITLKSAPELIAFGADGIAVVSDVTRAPDPEARTKEWLELFNRSQNARKPYAEKVLPYRSASA